MTGSPPATLSVTLPSDTAWLHLVTNLARNAAEAAGLSEADANKVALATDEAVTNVIEHAYHGRPGHQIEIRLELRDEGIEVHIIHGGDPIDASRLSERYDPRELKSGRRGGYGIVLMKRYMDRVDFRPTADRRSECCLVKHRTVADTTGGGGDEGGLAGAGTRVSRG